MLCGFDFTPYHDSHPAIPRGKSPPRFDISHRNSHAHLPSLRPLVERWMLDVGCWMLDVGCWMLDVGCWMFDAQPSPKPLPLHLHLPRKPRPHRALLMLEINNRLGPLPFLRGDPTRPIPDLRLRVILPPQPEIPEIRRDHPRRRQRFVLRDAECRVRPAQSLEDRFVKPRVMAELERRL